MVIMRAATIITETIAEITLHDDCLAVVFRESSEAFRDTVRDCGLRWDGESRRWVMYFGPVHGDPQHRVAECAFRLIKCGIPVGVDPRYQQMIESGDYKSMPKRYVVALPELFLLSMPYGDPIFETIRSISGARYSRQNRGITLPFSRAGEVQDLSDIHEFTLSEGTFNAIRNHEQSMRDAVIVEITDRQAQKEQKNKQAYSEIHSSLLDL